MSMKGRCDNAEIHAAHSFPWGESVWNCPGLTVADDNVDDPAAAVQYADIDLSE